MMAGYCSAESLLQTIRDAKPTEKSNMGQNFAFMVSSRNFTPFDLPKSKYDEVYPGIYLGDHYLAYALGDIKKLKITHILNAAKGTRFSNVNTNANTYAQIGVDFMAIKAIDTAGFNLSIHFESAADYIEEALKSNGIVYVHCHQGISRSATLVAAFLMLKRGMTAPEALITIRKKRSVMPNSGFLKQLAELHNQLYSNSNEGESEETEDAGKEREAKKKLSITDSKEIHDPDSLAADGDKLLTIASQLMESSGCKNEYKDDVKTQDLTLPTSQKNQRLVTDSQQVDIELKPDRKDDDKTTAGVNVENSGNDSNRTAKTAESEKKSSKNSDTNVDGATDKKLDQVFGTDDKLNTDTSSEQSFQCLQYVCLSCTKEEP